MLYFDKDLTRTVSKLSHKLGISKKHIIRLAITDMAAFFLGSPEEYITFQKKEWEKALRRIELRVRAEMRKEEERYQILSKIEGVSNN